mmetsp:Transcript_59460/g.134025  ORF Transcript_59460/g.134025 Transcript_59460/m.134025 type:complete len:362 (+) Transcript_59460:49-1134(+)|eukprot:CAMPEP_0197926814 /NCGR_PEP_ID=MMETSP1439-20131203/99752_1 /TAXON_ID=66791 /ORGANISM="Gonyaulax spinifera, Strain CCMP409" /LENGTH=361 /DNA_ID=CAMNT_0043549365 /DNA_START=49 /DNA_END=1134 /DNA_ORIENTATION=-
MADCIHSSCCEASFYKESGPCQKLARNNAFKNVSCLVTTLFCVWISINTDFNAAESLTDADMVFQLVHWVFVAFFLLEMTLRIGALEKKGAICKLPLIVLAVVLNLLLAVGPLFGGSVACFSHGFQVLRLVQLASNVPELAILGKGILVAARSSFFCLLLLTVVTYAFGVLMTLTTSGTQVGEKRFSSVPQSMLTLLLDVLFVANLPDVAHEVQHRPVALLVLMTFVVLAFTVVVITAGVTCEVVSTVAGMEKHRFMVQSLASHLRSSSEGWTSGATQAVSRESFIQELQRPEVSAAFARMGISASELAKTSEELFDTQSFQSLEEVVSQLLRLSPGSSMSQASFRDVLGLGARLQKGKHA